MLMKHNQYAPTKGALSAASAGDLANAAIEIASRSRRLANLVVDVAAYAAIWMLTETVNGMVNLIVGVDLVGLAGPVVAVVVLFIYYFASEALFGKTVGKLMTRTRVVAESGAEAQLWRIFLRTLYRFVPFEAISFLVGPSAGWHDRWSKTRVVIVRRG